MKSDYYTFLWAGAAYTWDLSQTINLNKVTYGQFPREALSLLIFLKGPLTELSSVVACSALTVHVCLILILL